MNCMSRGFFLGTVALCLAACSGGGTVELDSADGTQELVESDLSVGEIAIPDIGEDLPGFDVKLDWSDSVAPDAGPACAPGDGCFLDPCLENGDCQSGWCVEHMGEGVCSQLCSEECPPGWACKQVGASDPDLIFVCVSAHSNLCKPCAMTADCKAAGGAEDVCVAYGAEGSFCGGTCAADDDCPWGFSCLTTVTVDGIDTLQCVADAGECPCTGKSVELSLWTPCESTNDFGICGGKRVCTIDGLTDCDAAVAALEGCNGLDDDCDGDLDEPFEVAGDYVNLCNDENPCTDDLCTGETGCENIGLDEASCDDGEPCTAADHCETGTCIGSPVECEDNNPCTDDICTPTGGCEHLANSLKCDDKDPCTVADECEAGGCGGTAVACDCQDNSDCGALEDGDLCNGTLFCDFEQLPYKCAVKLDSIVECPAPTGIGAPCLAAACEALSGECSLEPANDGALCDDGDECTVKDLCSAGLCVSGNEANCNDGNLCTDDSCDPGSGCLHSDNESPCSDGDVCTQSDLCSEGECIGGAALFCDDSNVCTADTCSPDTGCIYAPAEGDCSDGNACTSGDTCDDGKCSPGGAVDCNDDNPCTADACTPATGCSNLPADGLCSDGDPCTVGDLCLDGSCSPGLALDCDDGNSCTDDTCGEEGQCIHKANEAQCDDGNGCTLGDYCHEGNCLYNGLLDCDDDEVCTDDLCDPKVGCLSKPNTATCDDGNPCTVGDTCKANQCEAGAAIVCDDGNLCTDDSCDAAKGCVYEANDTECDDGNACTTGDHCSQGWCGGAILDCNDDNLCTDDSCDIDAGCIHAINTVPCDDGNFCTLGDKCAQGICEGGVDVPCGDGAFCNGEESCDPETGCVAGIPPVVDDAIACTVDSCDEDNDVVVNSPDDQACPEAGLCETSACDANTGCIVDTVTDCCGNELVEDGETCDDGNEEIHDSCVACQDSICGDGFRADVGELCDGDELGPETCADVAGAGFEGDLSCNEDCTYNSDACIGPLGTVGNPATSCKAILDAGDSTGDKVYYLKAGDETVEAYCDMSGGGWTLVTSWKYALTGGKTWGGFDSGENAPSPSKQHAIPFRSIITSPSEARFVYLGNNQSITFTIADGAAWETEGEGCRIAISGGRKLVFERVHCSNGQGICAVNATYGSGFNCDGDNGQIAGQGLFNECTGNEFCNCGSYGWKYSTGGCTASVCNPPAQLAVYLR
jgi:hypothetical protein